MISALTTDQTHARGVTADVVIGERNLECSVDCLRTRVTEKYMIESAGASAATRLASSNALGWLNWNAARSRA